MGGATAAAGAPRGGAFGGAYGGAFGGAYGGAFAGASGFGGSGGAQSCTGIICAPIPSSCRKLIQDPAACCPTCVDTGCGLCAPLTCPVGTHQETVKGDCCPSCVANPPDQCTRGQKDYANTRQQMFEKYSSSGCRNSPDCTLVLESNACAYVCNVPLPKALSSSFTSGLQQLGATNCATCSAPTKTTCESLIPACLNGKCVGASPR